MKKNRLFESILKEDEEPSSTPFLDTICSIVYGYGYQIFDDITDNWPDEYDYYSEVADAVGADYDDIKQYYEFDQLGESDCLKFVTEHDGENVAKKIFGTIENIQKSFDEFNDVDNNDENNEFKKFIDYFKDDLNEYEEQNWKECVQSDIEDWEASNDDNDDDDYDYEDDDDAGDYYWS